RVIAALDRIGEGEFEPHDASVNADPVRQIGEAVNSMAGRIKSRIEDLNYEAQRDPLTGLSNRNFFQRNVERMMADAGAHGRSCLLFIDIDGFKAVNDALGHHYGDRLLQLVADRLRLATRIDANVGGDDGADEPMPTTPPHAALAHAMPANATPAHPAPPAALARFGGDEFVVFLPDVGSDARLRKLTARIQRVLKEPFEMGAHAAGVGASIGVAFSPDNGRDYIDLLRAADTAMYHAKRSGRNRVEYFTSALDDAARRGAEEEQELHEALARGEFELYFQPLYDCRTLKITSAEALIRWHHPTRGLVMPSEFLPVAERANLTGPIGEWVIGEATRRIAWLAQHGKPLQISVNVSPSQLQHLDFLSLVKASLNRWNAPPNLLELEITEDVAMRDADMVADRLSRISKLGVSIAIDDFGTGYSNLASLIQLPFSRLKIDRSLLQGLTVRPEARVLVQTIISMANSLGFHSVAEGVENEEQLTLLSAMGCDVVQGFLLS
ncbi:MAG: putative bifunctional diguanylate cyclase/phosphodiesterase, partial [Sphingopyxis sp.]